MKSQAEPLSGGMEVASRTVKSIKKSLREYSHDEATLRSALESEKAHSGRKTAIEALENAVENADSAGSGTAANQSETMSESTDDVTMEQACEVIAAELPEHTANYADKADLTGEPKDTVATAVTRKLSAGATGYAAFFGPCADDDCDRGANGFDTDYCDQCEPPEESGDSEAESGETTLADLSPEQIAELSPEQIAELK